MKSSGSTTSSAPSLAARARAARALTALPSTSPTVGLSWASVILNSAVRSLITYAHIGYNNNVPSRAGLQSPALDRSYALGDGKQPEDASHQQSDADRRRSHVLDPPDLRVVIGGQAIGELLDRGVEELDNQNHDDSRHQFDAAHGGGPDQPGKRDREQKREQLLANGLLRADCEDQAVARVDGGPPESQQAKIPLPLRPASPCPRAAA